MAAETRRKLAAQPQRMACFPLVSLLVALDRASSSFVCSPWMLGRGNRGGGGGCSAVGKGAGRSCCVLPFC